MNEQDWWSPWRDDEHFRLWPGTRPLLVSLPHDGSEIPLNLQGRLTENARTAPDTDWHVSRLYDFARALGASVLKPRWSRYVVDLNRPPDGAALYPGQSETGLCPTITFARDAIYQPGLTPDSEEINERVNLYWRPYHSALAATLTELRQNFERVVLWEGHSIVGTCPMFFAGRLPDFNLGTADGKSCDADIGAAVAEVLIESGKSYAINGRFKGGYITRHYGQPQTGVSAIQMELVQSNYMREGAPYAYDESLAAITWPVLASLLQTALAVASTAD